MSEILKDPLEKEMLDSDLIDEDSTLPKPQKQNLPEEKKVDKHDLLISWIIIGRNWLLECDLLVESLNNQNINTQLVELIIIDDCSDDESIETLQNIKYQNKKIIQLKEQSGRCYARNYGINLASGEFCLFTNGNLIPEKNFLNKYINLLSTTDIDGAAGIINYSSSDRQFQNYLNNSKRGTKKFQEGALLPIEYVLFGNCVINTEMLKKIDGFNEGLTGYGGEELELLSRMQYDKELILLKIDASVTRIHHPGLNDHCNRLIEFGKTNFKLLPNEIQKKIIPSIILKIYKLIPISIILFKLMILNKLLKGRSFLLIKSIMGLSILRGYKRKN